MSVRVVETPGLIISLEDMKLYLNVTHTDHDDMIESLIYAAQQVIEHNADASFVDQTLEYTVDEFASPIRLPRIPLADTSVSIESVIYEDADGEDQPIDADNYRLVGADLYPVSGYDWPTPSETPGSIRITYTVGAQDVPHGAIQAARLMVSDMYDTRSSTVPGQRTKVDHATTVGNLLATVKNWSV